MESVRVSVKAIIVRDDALLALKFRDKDGDWHMLPGGGQEWGETVHDALRRECREEIGCDVDIHGLRFVRDYIGKNHEFAAVDGHVHGAELMFDCALRSEPGVPTNIDTGQLGYGWIALGRLVESRLYPLTVAAVLDAADASAPVYLGDCN
jgi:ADP-ribose pyrophosphatase YjhB (NUDIX family)